MSKPPPELIEQLKKNYRTRWSQEAPDIPYGFCQCGCGQRTNLRRDSELKNGIPAGQPWRYLPYHYGYEPQSDVEYIEEARGYETSCWIWQLATKRNGYGATSRNGKAVYAHREYYRRHKGALTPGKELDHLCRVRLCVNPDHLEEVTRTVNVRRGHGVKLCEEDVANIRALWSTGEFTQLELGAMFHVHPSNISRVVRHERWKEDENEEILDKTAREATV